MWETAVRLAVAGGVFDGVFLCCPFIHWMSWMRSGTWLGQFLRDFLPTLQYTRSMWYQTSASIP